MGHTNSITDKSGLFAFWKCTLDLIYIYQTNMVYIIHTKCVDTIGKLKKKHSYGTANQLLAVIISA